MIRPENRDDFYQFPDILIFSKAYIPTVFESYVQQVQVDDTSVELALWDTAGQEEYDRFRIHSYPNADIILVCFALNNSVSLSNIEKKVILFMYYKHIINKCQLFFLYLVASRSLSILPQCSHHFSRLQEGSAEPAI